jgi:hypothetical protein
MKKTINLVVVVLAFASTTAFAQSEVKAQTGTKASSAIALNELEQREAEGATRAVASADAELQQRWVDVLNAPLEKAVEVVAAAKLAFKDLQLARLQREKVLSKHQSSHACGECQYSKDGKSLVRPEK